jgi:hypothetical protein
MTAELTACRGHARHHQMGVAHGGREKPFVAAQQILAAAAALMHGRATVVLARTSEPPCFSVMPMPIQMDFSGSRADRARRTRG